MYDALNQSIAEDIARRIVKTGQMTDSAKWQVKQLRENGELINMCLVHPLAVITPTNYEFAQLDPPSAGSEGKWEYFEESFEDVFLLPNKVDAIAFNITKHS